MNRLLTLILFLLIQNTFAQSNLYSWLLNTTGITGKYYEVIGGVPTGQILDTGSPPDVQTVCYSNDSIWIECSGLAEIMGPYYNPGVPTDQHYTWRFPKNPSQQTGARTVCPNVFAIGVLINGVPVYGNSNAFSYSSSSNSNVNNGQHIWNVDAWYGESMAIDTAYGGHPQQQGAYHSHATPHRMYSDPSSVHSPLIGWAFDGYPIYGPFAYTNPLDSTGGLTRMISSYQLRNITQRHSLPDGTILSANQYGPDVSMNFPLGMYIEDYEYISGLGNLDEYNGRFCITPEFPNGTYVYFVASNTDRSPRFPYYIGSHYYGVVDTANLNPTHVFTIPAGSNCLSTGIPHIENLTFSIYPNPLQTGETLRLKSATSNIGLTSAINIYNMTGQQIFSSGNIILAEENTLELNAPVGVYQAEVIIGQNRSFTRLLIQ